MKYSLVNVSREYDGMVDGVWIQNHIGTIDSAGEAARATERANSNRITVAVVDDLGYSEPNYSFRTGLKRLDFKRNIGQINQFSVKKMIAGEECECFEFSDPFYGASRKMRLQLEGTFDGDINRESLILVPMFLTESELSAIEDLWLTEQEKELGLPLGESCSSAGWWVGSSDASKDQDITDKYDFLVPVVLANKDSLQRLQSEVDILYKAQDKIEKELKAEYEDGESNWASQLELELDDLERLISEHEELLKQSMALTVKPSLKEQIQTASNRTMESHSPEQQHVQAPSYER